MELLSLGDQHEGKKSDSHYFHLRDSKIGGTTELTDAVVK